MSEIVYTEKARYASVRYIFRCLNCESEICFTEDDVYDPGLDGYTKIFCTQSGNFLGETKTRWLANGYSYIDVPNDCPLNVDEDEEDYNPD